MPRQANPYIPLIENRFEMSRQHVIVLKCSMKITYEELYHHLIEREEYLLKAQEVCYNLSANDIQHAFQHKNSKDKWFSAYWFLQNLYTSVEKGVNKLRYDSCKAVLKYLGHI